MSDSSDTAILVMHLNMTKKIVKEILADLELAKALRSDGWVGELVSELHMYQAEVNRLTAALNG